MSFYNTKYLSSNKSSKKLETTNSGTKFSQQSNQSKETLSNKPKLQSIHVSL